MGESLEAALRNGLRPLLETTALSHLRRLLQPRRGQDTHVWNPLMRDLNKEGLAKLFLVGE